MNSTSNFIIYIILYSLSNWLYKFTYKVTIENIIEYKIRYYSSIKLFYIKKLKKTSVLYS